MEKFIYVARKKKKILDGYPKTGHVLVIPLLYSFTFFYFEKKSIYHFFLSIIYFPVFFSYIIFNCNILPLPFGISGTTMKLRHRDMQGVSNGMDFHLLDISSCIIFSPLCGIRIIATPLICSWHGSGSALLSSRVSLPSPDRPPVYAVVVAGLLNSEV